MEDEREPRRPRGWLMSDMEAVLRQWEAGEVDPELLPIGPKGAVLPMTAHRACDLLVAVEQLDPSSRPSSGAVTNIFKKWEKARYAMFGKSPYSFEGFTQEGADLGFDAMWEKYVTNGGPTVEELRQKLEAAESDVRMREAELALLDGK